MSVRILHGDCRAVLPTLPEASVQCVVTSPPYYALRDYGVAGQIGLEASPDAYVAEMVAVFREVRRVLRDDGTCWLNIGDSYAGGGGFSPGAPSNAVSKTGLYGGAKQGGIKPGKGIKAKDLLMIPARVALALQADGWYLRSDIIWHKPNPMPESVTDRPTSAHEHVFLLTKRAAYYYDADAVREACSDDSHGSPNVTPGWKNEALGQGSGNLGKWTAEQKAFGRNARNVWTIATHSYSGAHFATMPPELVERCIKAGSRPGDAVLDPFSGAGTTALVADRLGRNAIGIELNPTYAAMANHRVTDDAPLLASVELR